MKALILAAGFGTRLRPFTNEIPKPLCPFFGVSFLDLALHRVLPYADEIAINCHHLHTKIESHIERYYPDQSFRLSVEDEIRGTGGALFPLKTWLGDDDLLIYNADIISDIDLNSFISKHESSDSLATMMMLESPSPGKTPIYCEGSKVISIGNEPEEYDSVSTFSGIHIVSNEFVQRIPCQSPWSIIDTYHQLLSENRTILLDKHGGFWEDLGTPHSLWQGHQKVIDNQGEPLLRRLGVTTIREQRSLPPIHIDKESRSAWSSNLSFSKPPFQSYVELHEQVACSIKNSVLVYSSDLTNQPIHDCVYINDLKDVHSGA